MRTPEPLVAIEAVAAIYPVSIRQVRRWQSYGCPSRLIGRKRLFKLSAVESWLTHYNSGDWSDWQLPADRSIEPMFKVKKMLRLYPISRRQFNRWIKMGCPSRKVGHTRFFRPSAVEAWIEKLNQGDWAEAA